MVQFILRVFAGLFAVGCLPLIVQLLSDKSYYGAAVPAVLALLSFRYAFARRSKATRRGRSVVTSRFALPDDEEASSPRRSRGPRKPPAPLVNNIWPGKHGCVCEVVGESHYQDALTEAVGAPPTQWNEVMVTASLVCETNNRHDPMAVAVCVNGKRVGYLRAEYARVFHDRLKRRGIAGQTTHCGALIRGGGIASDGKQRMYGIMLNIQPFN
jgi:hypothetical protein